MIRQFNGLTFKKKRRALQIMTTKKPWTLLNSITLIIKIHLVWWTKIQTFKGK